MKIPASFLETVDKEYNKSGLEKFYRAFLRDFIERNKDLCQQQDLDISILKRKTIKKPEITEAFANVLYNEEIFEKLRKELPQPLPQVIELLLWEGAKPHQELERTFGVTIIKRESGYHYDVDALVEPLYLCLAYQHTYNEFRFRQTELPYNFTFYLPHTIRKRLLQFYEIPAAYTLTPVEKPTEAPFTYEDKEVILEEIPLFLTYKQQGDLKVSNSGKPQASSVNKMRKACSSREFFPEAEDSKELTSLRTMLVAEALQLTDETELDLANVPQTLKLIVKHFSDGNLSVLYSLLFHLKGVGYVKSVYEERSVNRQLVNILRDLPTGEWIELGNLFRHIKVNYPPLRLVSEHTAANYLYFEVEETSIFTGYLYKDKEYIKRENYEQAITLPMIKGTLFLFAALGMVDIVYDSPFEEKNEAAAAFDRTYFSLFDGLKYVKLNALGAYVLGKTQEYTVTKKASTAQIHLEENHLIISVSGEDKVLEVVIDKFAVKTGESRYKVDYASFLKDCQTKKDIENKIALFGSRITDNPPQIWKDFFSELLAKYNPLQKLSKYQVFRIPPQNKELIALIARDETLKRLSFKAEDYHILIAEKDWPTFRSRLEKFGYLMEKGRGKE